MSQKKSKEKRAEAEDRMVCIDDLMLGINQDTFQVRIGPVDPHNEDNILLEKSIDVTKDFSNIMQFVLQKQMSQIEEEVKKQSGKKIIEATDADVRKVTNEK